MDKSGKLTSDEPCTQACFENGKMEITYTQLSTFSPSLFASQYLPPSQN